MSQHKLKVQRIFLIFYLNLFLNYYYKLEIFVVFHYDVLKLHWQAYFSQCHHHLKPLTRLFNQCQSRMWSWMPSKLKKSQSRHGLSADTCPVQSHRSIALEWLCFFFLVLFFFTTPVLGDFHGSVIGNGLKGIEPAEWAELCAHKSVGKQAYRQCIVDSQWWEVEKSCPKHVGVAAVWLLYIWRLFSFLFLFLTNSRNFNSLKQ